MPADTKQEQIKLSSTLLVSPSLSSFAMQRKETAVSEETKTKSDSNNGNSAEHKRDTRTAAPIVLRTTAGKALLKQAEMHGSRYLLFLL